MLSELHNLSTKLCSKQYNKILVLHLIVVPHLGGSRWHNYSTKTRQVGRANEQSMYSLMSMVLMQATRSCRRAWLSRWRRGWSPSWRRTRRWSKSKKRDSTSWSWSCRWFMSMEQRTLKNVNNCCNINISFYSDIWALYHKTLFVPGEPFPA